MTPHAIEGLEAVAIAALLVHGAARSTTVRHIAGAPARARRRRRNARDISTDQVENEISPDPPVFDPAAVDLSRLDPDRRPASTPIPHTLAGIAAELNERKPR